MKKSSFKGAYITTLSGILSTNKENQYNYTFKICKEIFLTLPNVIYVRKNFYLTDAINLVISHLQSSGLIEYWNANDIGKQSMWMKMKGDGDNGPKVISLEQLVGHFQLLGGGLLIAFITFLIEVFCTRLMTYLNRLNRLQFD